MIDKNARDTLANALSGYMQRWIYSDAFAETVTSYAWCEKTQDPSVIAIAEVLDSLYDDSYNAPLHVPPQAWDVLLRTLAFLGTDLDYTHGKTDLPDTWDGFPSFWPFASEQEWKDHERLCPAPPLKYDPALWPPPKRESTARHLAKMSGILLVAITILIAVVVVLAHLGYR